MKVNLKIKAQYLENSEPMGWDGKGFVPQNWSKKGIQIFDIEVDDDMIMYSTKMEQHIKELLKFQGSSDWKYEYIDHSIEYLKPINLSCLRLYELIKKEY